MKKWLATLVALLAFTASGVSSQATMPAVPVEPVTAVLDAFKTHRIVALGEGAHGNEQSHAFRLSLIRDPRFTRTVNDILVEFGNSAYQDVMDRFVRGEEVSPSLLRRIWQDTTQPGTGLDKAMYEAFFHEVRLLNRRLPRSRRLRVLLGDPPIDWTTVQTQDDLNPWLAQRDRFPAEVVRRQVLAKGRRALIIYGDGHLFRVPVDESLVSILEADRRTRVFTIGAPISTPASPDLTTLYSHVASWPVPSLIGLRGTDIGATSMDYFYGAWPRRVLIEQTLDALLYLGPPSSMKMAPLNPALCRDPEYVELRTRRMAIAFRPIGRDPAEGVRRYCAGIKGPR